MLAPTGSVVDRIPSRSILSFVPQTRFQGLASSERYKRERELICSAHRSQERFMVFRSPQLPDSISGYIANPFPDRDRPAQLALRYFAHDFLSGRRLTNQPSY